MCCIIDTWVRTHLLCLAWSDLLGIRSEKDVQVIRVFWPPSLQVVWPSTQRLDGPSLPSLSLLRLCKNTPIYTYQYLNIKISNFCCHTSQHNAEISHWFDVDYCRVEDKRTNDSLPTGSHWSNNNCALTRIYTLLHQYKHFFCLRLTEPYVCAQPHYQAVNSHGAHSSYLHRPREIRPGCMPCAYRAFIGSSAPLLSRTATVTKNPFGNPVAQSG
jgi:hypothetical protein